MDFMHIWGQKEAIWNTFFIINWFGHGILENQIQALSRTFRHRFKDFQGSRLFSRTFKDRQEPSDQCKMSSTVSLHTYSVVSSITLFHQNLKLDIWPKIWSISHSASQAYFWWKSVLKVYISSYCLNKHKRCCFQHILFHWQLTMYIHDNVHIYKLIHV